MHSVRHRDMVMAPIVFALSHNIVLCAQILIVSHFSAAIAVEDLGNVVEYRCRRDLWHLKQFEKKMYLHEDYLGII